MLELDRNQKVRRLRVGTEKSEHDWDFDAAFGHLDVTPNLRVSSKDEIRDHYNAIRDVLKRYAGMDSQGIADLIGVGRQTSYQYGFRPEARGARTIPAGKLDLLRMYAVIAIVNSHDNDWLPGADMDTKRWQLFNHQGHLLIQTLNPLFAVSQATRLGGIVVAHPRNPMQDIRGLEFSEEDARCIQWLYFRHRGNATREDAMRIAAVDEYLVERVGLESRPWRIIPTEDQIAALAAAHERNVRDVA